MNINRDELVRMAVNLSVDHPRVKSYRGSYDGKARICVGPGGITYSHAIGDNCMKVAGDHVEPGVSMANSDGGKNMAAETFSCIGNEVTVISGPMKGAKGIVTGTHGGVEHTMAWFEPAVLEQMDGTENFLVKAYGQGMKVEETPDVFWMNLDPSLLEAIHPEIDENGVMEFPVAAVLPAFLMGSGVGAATMMNGDYDIMTQDAQANETFGINDLRFGDFVAVMDHDSRYGPHYSKDMVTIGVVVHSDSFTSGHGPGLTVIATGPASAIKPVKSEKANLVDYLDTMERVY